MLDRLMVRSLRVSALADLACGADLLRELQGIPKVMVFDYLAASEAHDEAPWDTDRLTSRGDANQIAKVGTGSGPA
jgi:hypothetical protein